MLKTSLFGDDWKIFVLDEETFVKRFKEGGLAGLTDSTNKQIFLNSNDMSIETIRHELFHAAKYYTCTSSADLNEHQLEEVYCDLYAVHGPKLDRAAKLIHDELEDMKE